MRISMQEDAKTSIHIYPAELETREQAEKFIKQLRHIMNTLWPRPKTIDQPTGG